MKPHTWTPADVEQITKLWAEGHSASQIGFLMGHTRNAIIGKAHRLNLASRSRPPAVRKPDKRTRTGDRHLRAKLQRPKVERIVKPAPRQIAEPDSLDIAVIDLEARQCRWIAGVGTHLHCGHSTYDGSSYCEHHYARVYVPQKPRVRTPERMTEAA